MDIVKQLERIHKRPSSKYQPGTVDRVFEKNDRNGLDESGNSAVFIKPTPEEKKQKRSIN